MSVKLKYRFIDPERVHKPLTKAYEHDAGIDLPSAVDLVIPPKGKADINTNIKIELPPGYWGLISGRSSTFYLKNLYVNPGIIDNGYRGELKVVCYNTSDKNFCRIKPGDRIGQLILFPIVYLDLEVVDILSDSDRGEKGFGSTGE